jgi:hypothetical protein
MIWRDDSCFVVVMETAFTQVREATRTDMKATTFAHDVEKRVRTTVFIVGILLLGFLPIVFATFFLLVEDYAADAMWAFGIASVLSGVGCLITYVVAERNARRAEQPPPPTPPTPPSGPS